MNPLFFVQNNLVDRVTVPVAKYARSKGIELIDRSSTIDFKIDDCGIDWTQWNPVLPYGSVQLVRKLKASSLAPYIWHDEVNFSAQTWKEQMGGFWFNHTGFDVPAGEVASVLARAELGAVRHVRPLSEDKAFHAKCFDSATWAETLLNRELAPDLSCWVSPAKPIEAEWRCWIVGGQMVGASQYRHAGAMHVVDGAPPYVWDYVKAAAAHWLPAPCVVMDVAQSNGALSVLEFNPIHGSGWYAVDVEKVLDAWVAWSVEHFRKD